MSVVLALESVTAGYGEAPVLEELSLTVGSDEIVVLIGPNGAGKSTALKTLVGLVRVKAGQARFGEQVITNRPPEAIIRLGLGYVPQVDNVFASLTVEENLEIGAFTRRGKPTAALERIYAIFPPLIEKRRQPAGQLSGGQRQMVAIGRALMLEPRALLLDEPTAGLSPKYMAETFALVRRVNALGVAILMVEQNARPALAIAHRAYLLVAGRVRREGTGADLLADERLAEQLIAG